MNHPENMPSPENINRRISHAEIAKQQLELEAHDERVQQLMAQRAIVADPESVRIIGELLTGKNAPTSTAMDSVFFNDIFGIKDKE